MTVCFLHIRGDDEFANLDPKKKEEEWSSGQLEGKSERIKSEQVAFKHLATPLHDSVQYRVYCTGE